MAHQPEMAEPESTKPRKTGLCVGSGGAGGIKDLYITYCFKKIYLKIYY